MKLALVGCGALARVFYLPVLKNIFLTPEVLVDPDTRSIEELARLYNAKNISASLEEIADDIDAAIIASPNFLHFSQAKYLLERGKHVLLEKPIASTGQQIRELVRISQQFSVVLQPAMMRRFWKINKVVKKMLQEEVLGTLRTVSMQEGGVLNWPVQSAAIFNPRQSLGGVFLDTGSHTLDLLCWWVNDKNFLLEYEDDNHGGVEADCRLKIEFTSAEVKAEIALSRIRNMPNEFILSGSRGWIKLKPYGNVFETSDRSIEKYIYSIYSATELKQQTFQDLFTEQVQSWMTSAEKHTNPVIDAESVQTSIQMIEQGYHHRKQMAYNWD